MPQSRLDILLNAQNNASGPIQQVRGALSGLDSAAANAAGGIGGLAAAAGVAGLLLLGQQAAAATVDLSRTGVEVALLRESLDRLAADAGESGDAILEALRGASRGAIADSDLIQAANRALLLGVAKNSDDMTKLMEIAAVRGRAMGLTVSQAFNDIVTGLGRGSALILDNLGIVVNATEANEKYALSLGKTAAALTEAEKKQALINTVLGDASISAGASVNPFERAGASISNLKVAVGEFINTSLHFPDLLNSIADAADNVTSAIGEGMKATAEADMFALGDSVTRLGNEYQRQAEQMRQAAIGGDVAAMREAANGIEMIRTSLVNVGEEYNRAAAITGAPLLDIGMLRVGEVAFRNTATAIDAVSAAATIATGSIDDLMRALGNQAFAQSQDNWQRMTGAIDSAATAAGRLFAENVGGGAGLQRQQALTDELTAQVGYWRIQGYSIEQINDVLLPGYVAGIQDADRALFNTTAQTKALKDAASDAERAFNDLKGKVEGVLQEALHLDVGVNPDDFLPRADAINENARRLADIMVNGFKGQDWLDEFKREVPDIYAAIAAAGDPKTAAAQALKEFEAGLRPELIDREAAKERVRQMLLGEQNLSELAQEIAAELAAEMGTINSAGLQSMVGRALGLRGDDIAAGLSAGQEYAEGAMSAVADTAPGTVMVQTLNLQLRMESNLKLIRTAGNDTGVVWGDGFLAGVDSRGVPDALIRLLVSLVTPGVQAGLAVQATLEGAAP